MFSTLASLSVSGRQKPYFSKAGSPEKSLKIIIEGKSYYVHAMNIYRALEDAHFKAYILRLASLPELTIEDMEKEVTTLTKKA
jgi:hypothetical protein